MAHLFHKLLGMILLCVIAPSMHALPDMSSLSSNTTSTDKAKPAEVVFKSTVYHERNDSGGINWLVRFDIEEGYYLYRKKFQVPQGYSLKIVTPSSTKLDKYFGEVEIFNKWVELTITSDQNATLVASNPTLTYQGCAIAGLCYPPKTLNLTVNNTKPADGVNKTESADQALSEIENIDNTTEFSFSNSAFWKQQSIPTILATFLVIGLGLSLTPCIFPMIPILSSIIVGQKEITTQKGLILSLSYVLGMSAAYACIGAFVVLFGKQLNIAVWMQNTWILTITAGLFMILSLSMFGAFELQLPRFLQDKLQQVQGRQQGGDLYSTFFMGLISALVVSPCVTAPLAGALVYLSTTGDILVGGSALAVLGIGMGAPLILVGITGGKILPKAGTWMIFVKGIFGFGLLLIAISLVMRILPIDYHLYLYFVFAILVAITLYQTNTNHTIVNNIKNSIATVSLLIGILWVIGGASGSTDILLPLSNISINNQNTVNNQAEFQKVNNVTSLKELITQNNKDGNKTLIDVNADWCTSCKDVHKLLVENTDKIYESGYDIVVFDITDNTKEHSEVLTSVNIFGPPALIKVHNPQDLEKANQERVLQGVPSEQRFHEWIN